MLNENDFKKHKYSLLIFRLNLGERVLDILPVNINLKIDADLTDLNPKPSPKNTSLEKVENTKKERQLNKVKIISSDNRTYSFQVRNFILILINF